VIVLDGCGAGAAPDAAEFGDHDGPSTIKHVWDSARGIDAPFLASVGFFAACGVLESRVPSPESRARYGRLRPLGMGKDSVTGHWEMMGAVVERAFPTYPNGFPPSFVRAFEKKIGRQTIGNVAASGTAIIEDLGPLHQETGMPIVYTSADSVFQIACHEDVVSVTELYSMCREARSMLVEPDDVQRVIARPFTGSPGAYVRTERRKDFPLSPPPNLVDDIGDVFGIGVVPELFDGRGFRSVRRTQSNAEHWSMLWEALSSDARFVFANFEDFDMKYGHRNDAPGFTKCLEEFDAPFGELLTNLRPNDLLIVTADHGNDPTDASTDHSREYVPVCVVGSAASTLGDRDGLSCVGATVAAQLGTEWKYLTGSSLLL
jgi:phosphopentomutase